MSVLGIDPGYAILGWGIVAREDTKLSVERCGAVTTAAGVPFERRLEILYNELESIIRENRPDAMAIEQLFFTTNQKTVIQVAQARGVVLLAAVKAGLPIYEYTPLQVKQAVVGYGKAEKRQVMEMTKRMLHLAELPKPDDVADALAVAACHLAASGSLLFGGRPVTAPSGEYSQNLLARNPQLRQLLAGGSKEHKAEKR